MFFSETVHRLLEFFVLLGEGLHPLNQLVTVLGSLSDPLEMHNDNDKRKKTMTTKNFWDSVSTSICFTTPSRADFSLFISLGVSSSSTTTTSSPCLRRIRTDWVQGSSRMISSTSSSSFAAVGLTAGGLHGWTVVQA